MRPMLSVEHGDEEESFERLTGGSSFNDDGFSL